MIELIFAIVIIAISVISLPMMVQTTTKGIENNIVQEAIFATAALLNESTTYYWDANSMEDANTTSNGYSRVINMGDCSSSVPSKRPGHINRQCLDDNTTTPLNGPSAFEDQVIEQAAIDYNDTTIFQDNTTGVNAASYKITYNILATVNNCATAGACVQFGQEANNSNLKEITIQVTNTSTGDNLVLLRAYTANIGEVRVERKVF